MNKDTTDLRITPKRLGLIALTTYCPRCFWFLLHLRFHPPFNGFAGAIFDRMEQAELAVVSDLLERHGNLPDEFYPFCDLVSSIEFPRDYRKYSHTLNSGVTLYGEPDAIYRRQDKSLVIVDHKTADSKGGTDSFLPCYQIQTIGYGLIAEKGLKLGKVSEGGLFYWSAAHNDVVEQPDRYYRTGKLWMPFKPEPISVEMNYSAIAKPLEEATRVWELSTPPAGKEKCKDCKKLDALFAIEAEIEHSLATRDQSVLARAGNSRWVLDQVRTRLYQEAEKRRSAFKWLRDEAADLTFEDDGIVSNWADCD